MNLKSKIYKLLRKSEKYTKTDMVYLTKGGFWLTLGQFVSFLSSFFLAVAFANFLPKETYGTYKYILSIAGILAIPTLSGMDTAITQAVARGYEGSFIPALKMKIRWGALGGLASLILAGYYYLNNNIALTISFLITAFFVPFMNSFSIYGAFLQGRKLFKVSTKYSIISQIIAGAAMIAAVFLTNNLFIILLAYLVPWTSLRFIFLKITIKKFPSNTSQDPESIPYGKHLSIVNVLGAIAGQFDKILLFHFLGAAPLAVYSFALAPVVQLRSFFKPITPLVLPKLATKQKEDIKKTLPLKIIKFFSFIIVPVLAYIILAPYFYKIFFPKYLESIKYSQYFALVLLFFPKKLLGISLLAQAQKKAIYITATLSPLCKIILLILLLPAYGITGAITAQLLTHIFNTIVLFYLFKKM